MLYYINVKNEMKLNWNIETQFDKTIYIPKVSSTQYSICVCSLILYTFQEIPFHFDKPDICINSFDILFPKK